MNNHQQRTGNFIAIACIVLLLMVFLLSPVSSAAGPKSIYGTLYVNGQKAGAGIDVKIRIENQTFIKKTLNSTAYNYIIGLPPGYEGKIAFFFVGDYDVIPMDNNSFVIGSSIEYIFDLHVEYLTQNTPPVAVIESITPNPAAYNQTVRFIGRGTDSDGNISAYHWRSSLIGNLSVNRSFNLTTLQKGNHTIYFKVKDNHDAWSSEVSEILRITHYNRPPKATIDSVIPNIVRVNKPVSFKGHGNDTDGSVIGYSWRSNRSGVLSDKASFNTSGLSKGNHTIFFKVMDNTSYWSEEVKSWVLVVENMPPVARIVGPTQGSVGVPVQFDGTTSSDPDGTIVAWFWDFGDGTNSTVAQPTHTYTSENTYQIWLTVTDDSQRRANTITQIIIAQEEPLEEEIIKRPQKATVEGPTEGVVGTYYQFTLTASDPDFDSVFYKIVWGDGKETTTEFTSSITPLIVDHAWEKAGTYVINITTIDINYAFSPIQQYEIVISDAFLAGLDWLTVLIILIIIVVIVLLAILLIRRRKTTPPQPTPEPFLMQQPDEEVSVPYYPDQSALEPATSISQPIQKPSAFKRI